MNSAGPNTSSAPTLSGGSILGPQEGDNMVGAVGASKRIQLSSVPPHSFEPSTVPGWWHQHTSLPQGTAQVSLERRLPLTLQSHP